VIIQMLPVSATQTQFTCKWLVHAEAEAGRDYDLDALLHVWRETNDQDRRFVERNQRGVSSIGYRPGPYATESEHGVWSFVEWYARCMQVYVDADD
jgi:Rieske 2Fe-2S family protein